MNQDILRYKYRFVTFTLLLGYSYLHTQLTGTYIDVPLIDLMHFSARLPFGQRLLVPALANALSLILPLTVDQLFFLLEWLFISLFYFALIKLLRLEFNAKQAQLLSWLCILLLPLLTVINYRFSRNGLAAVFYPADTAALFFMAMGFFLCLQARWRCFVLWVFLATFNRESSILLVLMIPALYWQNCANVLKPTCFALLAYLLARILVLQFLHGVPGPLLEWYYQKSAHPNFEINMLWLLNDQNILLFMFCFAGLPLFWFAFFDYIPLQYRPLRYVALVYFLALLLVGNFVEARIFSEILLILYLPVCVAVKNWLLDRKLILPSKLGLAHYIDRYALLTLLLLVASLREFLQRWF